MGRLVGSIMVIIGLSLWYYGGTSGNSTLVNLGIGSIILGLVLAALPLGDKVEKDALTLTYEPFCEFFENLSKGLDLSDSVVVIPPYENLPRGALFLPKAERFSISLGRLSEGEVIVSGTEEESGVLISPPPGWGIVEYTLENVGEIAGTDVGYSSSAVSAVLSALGLGSAEAFEREDGRIEVFARPLCGELVYGDPVVSAVLLGIAMGAGELLLIESVEKKGEYVRLTVKRMGGVEEWL